VTSMFEMFYQATAFNRVLCWNIPGVAKTTNMFLMSGTTYAYAINNPVCPLTDQPTLTPSPTPLPSNAPSATPSASPTNSASPTFSPSSIPSSAPSVEPPPTSSPTRPPSLMPHAPSAGLAVPRRLYPLIPLQATRGHYQRYHHLLCLLSFPPQRPA